jgi:hypothetical protein
MVSRAAPGEQHAAGSNDRGGGPGTTYPSNPGQAQRARSCGGYGMRYPRKVTDTRVRKPSRS